MRYVFLKSFVAASLMGCVGACAIQAIVPTPPDFQEFQRLKEEHEHLKQAHKFLQAENKRLRQGRPTARKGTPLPPPPPPSAQHLLGGHGGMLQRSNAPKKKLVRKKDPRQMDVSLETIKKARQELRKTTSKV
ncbi:MAG: hypothetical protein V6Z78_02320 [Holosporaceae bacterium]